MLAVKFQQFLVPKLTRYLAVLILLCIAIAGLDTLAAKVYADPPNNDPVLLTCIGRVPPQVVSSCAANVASARNVASHHCNQTNNKDFANCVVNKATGYIREASGGHIGSANQFKSKLDNIFRRVGGDPNAPAPDPQGNPVCQSGSCADPAVGDAHCQQGQCDLIGKYVSPTINLLSLSFGVIAAISLIAGGIQYSSSAGDPQKAALGKRRISNTILAILAYMFLYAFLQFLIPGGIFNRVAT